MYTQSTTTLALLGRLLALQTLHLGSAISLDLSLSPGQPTVLAIERLSRDTGLFSSAPNLPVRLTIHITRTQLRPRRSIRRPNTSNHSPILIRRHDHVWLNRHICNTRYSDPVQLPAGRSVPRRGELSLLLETNPDIFAVRMTLGVKVVPHIARLRSVDGVVPANRAVLPGKPFRPALAVDETARNDVFAAGALRTETLSGGVLGVSVCGSLSGM